jgi:hypothetical protein
MAYATTVTLVASRTDTASVTEASGTAITGVDVYRKGTFTLVATAVSGTVALDVSIQCYVGGIWTDIARFAQVTGNAERVLWDVGGTLGTGTTTIEEASQTLDITVSTKRAGPWGTQLRARYVLVVTGSGSITWVVAGTIHS